MGARFRSITSCVVAAVSLAGCSSTGVRFEGVGPDGHLAPDVRYVLESAAGNEGSITVDVHGWRNAHLDGRQTDTVRFRLTIDNASADAIEIPLDALVATDDEQRAFRRVETALPRLPDGEVPDRALAVTPRERTTVEVLFDVGAPGALRTIGSVTLGWAYRFRGKENAHRTRFLPVVYRSSVAYHAGLYYGPVWYVPCW